MRKNKARYNNIFLLLTLLLVTLVIKFLYGQNHTVSVFRRWVPMSWVVIVIDPGHGGIDGGANYKDGTLEKDINLQVSLKLKRLLEKEGVNVIMTRTKDIALDYLNNKSKYRHKRDLISRVEIINKIEPDIFLSIHVNAERSSSKTSGPMVFYFIDSTESRKVAEGLQKKLENVYKSAGHNIITRNPVANNSLFVLKNTKVPGVIVELGFITNSKDRALLTSSDFQHKLSEAILLALKEYLS